MLDECILRIGSKYYMERSLSTATHDLFVYDEFATLVISAFLALVLARSWYSTDVDGAA